MSDLVKGEDYIVMSLPSVMQSLISKNWTKPQIAKTIGVTPLQITYYENGKTKKPSPKVCNSIFRNIKIDGKPVLVDVYNSIEDLEYHLEVFNNSKA